MKYGCGGQQYDPRLERGLSLARGTVHGFLAFAVEAVQPNDPGRVWKPPHKRGGALGRAWNV
jgi:hypothetical protein